MARDRVTSKCNSRLILAFLSHARTSDMIHFEVGACILPRTLYRIIHGRQRALIFVPIVHRLASASRVPLINALRHGARDRLVLRALPRFEAFSEAILSPPALYSNCLRLSVDAAVCSDELNPLHSYFR